MTPSTHSAALPEWPTMKFLRGTSMGADLIYQRQLAQAYKCRLELAVAALNDLYPALALDLRYESEENDKDALVSRVRCIEEALTAIGELPND